MARVIPENRFKDLLACATRVFIAQGYRRTQIADIARALGVAKGTVYLYVESKEALFVAALRYADGEPPAISELDLPVAAPDPATLVSELRQRLATEAQRGSLVTALERPRAPGSVRAELEEIVRELYALSSRHRTVVKLIDRCGRDHPELASAFYSGGRFTQLDQLSAYLDSRIRAGQLRPVPDIRVAARFIIEAIATWAVHIH